MHSIQIWKDPQVVVFQTSETQHWCQKWDKPQKQRSINQIERGDPVSEGSKIPKDTDSVRDNLCFKKPCPSLQICIVGDVKQRNEGIFIKGEIKK